MKKWIVVFLVEIALLLVGIAGLFRPVGVVAQSTKTEMTDALLGDGVPLKAGVYEAILYYETNEDGAHRFGVSAEDELPFRGLRFNEVTLFSDEDSVVCQFYLTASCEKLQAYVEEAEDGTVTVKDVKIVSSTAGSRILLFWVLLLSGVVNGSVWLYDSNQKKPLERSAQFSVAGIFVAILIAATPLMVDYVILGDKTVENLNVIEKISCDLGMAWSEGDLFLILPALFRKIGLSMNMSYRLYLWLINIVTVLVAYKSFRVYINDRGFAMTGCIWYSLNPYRIACLYEKTALSACVCMIFLPMLFIGILVFGKNKESHKRLEAARMVLGGIVGVLLCNAALQEITILCISVVILLVVLLTVFVVQRISNLSQRRQTIGIACIGTLMAVGILTATFQTNQIMTQGHPLWVYSMGDMQSAERRGLAYLTESTYGMNN